jgi:hypothetical protein
MPVALRLIQAEATGKDQVRPLEERVFELGQLRRRVFKRGELVHAVIDDHCRPDIVAKLTAIGV